MIPLGLYIHIPWCEKKCPYCDFNSHQAKSPPSEKSYVQALLNDLRFDLDYYKSSLQGRKIDTIFIGGGTPSLFSGESIKAILRGVAELIELSSTVEITLEANPGSAELEKFSAFYAAGVNRLSIGVQSFNNTHLKSLGRIHSSENALSAAQYAINAGFERFNLDLMYGLPEQTLSECLADLDQAIELQPSHLSCYQLTIEPNTLFHHKPPITPNDERLWEMHTQIKAKLKQAQYEQYEVSAYAQDKQQCRHNLNYWQFGDYLGMGAGAHAKITAPQGDVYRNWKVKHPASYQQRALDNTDSAGARTEVSRRDLPFEFMLNALRLSNGFELELFSNTTSMELNEIMPILEKHQNHGLITINNGWVQPSDRGSNMIDTLLQDYLPSAGAVA